MHDLSLLVFNHGFRFQDSLCNGCHDLTTLNDIAITTIKNVDYRCIINEISKSEAINLSEIILCWKILDTYIKYCLFVVYSRQFFLLFFILVYIK